MNRAAIRSELRTGAPKPPLRRRRAIAILAVVGLADAATVSLYQLGILRRLPDPPAFASNELAASRDGYAFGVPDGPLAAGQLSGVLVLSAAGGAPRGGGRAAILESAARRGLPRRRGGRHVEVSEGGGPRRAALRLVLAASGDPAGHPRARRARSSVCRQPTPVNSTGATEIPHVQLLDRAAGPPTPHRTRSPAPSGGSARAPSLDVRGLWAALRTSVEGEVRFDPGSRGLYAMDASNYRQVPLGVVIPKSNDDVVAAIAAARRFGAPVVSRTGGTALAGQTCNEVLVLDFSKYLNHVLEVNAEQRFARVELGVICDDLIDAARAHHLTWGPAPATHDRCCFGGMIANDSGGVHAQMSGSASNNVEELDLLLYDGTRMRVGWMDDAALEAEIARGGRIGQIHERLKALRDRYAPLIRERFPRIPRRVSGYNLDQLLAADDGRFNIARALVGSEGTLATMLEARVRLVYNHPARVLLVVGFDDVYQAGDAVPLALESNPIGLEGMDRRLYENVVRKGGPHTKYLPLLPAGGGWSMVELGEETTAAAIDRGHEVMDRLRKHSRALSMKLYTDEQEQKALWKVRESGLGATAFVPGEPDAWPGWEDSAVPPDRVGEYLRALRRLFDEYGYNPALYGHFGMGCIHCRVDFDLTSAEGIAKYERFVHEAAHVVHAFGALSGEHGDGQSRAELLSAELSRPGALPVPRTAGSRTRPSAASGSESAGG